MNIGKLSTANSVFVNIVTITLLLLGLLSVYRLPREQFVEVPFYWVIISVRYSGAPADEIEKTVTIKLEQELKNLPQLKRIQSSTTEGFALLRLEFRDGISSEEFGRLYQEAITRAGKVTLPTGADKPQIKDFSSADFLPVIQLVLYTSKEGASKEGAGGVASAGTVTGSSDGNVVRAYRNRGSAWGDRSSGEAGSAFGEEGALFRAARRLRDALESLPGVRSVSLFGSRDRKIFLEAEPERMETLGIAITDLVRAVETSSSTVPAGTLPTENREYFIRTGSDIEESSALSRIILRSGSTVGSVVRIADVAQIRDGYEDKGEVTWYNGSRAILLNVAKVSGGDSFQVVRGVKRAVETFKAESAETLQVVYLNDSTLRIKESIDVLSSNALVGLILLVGILFLFIGFRNGLIIGFGIPVTFAVTFLILDLLGETLNTNTLFGLVLVLGMLVDHGIVIVENAFRLQGEGLSKGEAAVRGVDEVALPVISATATTLAAFLPLMLLPGTIGKFLRVVPLVVSIALTVSTLEAIFFLPSHYADWPGGAKVRPPLDFTKIRPLFKRIFSILYKHRRLTILLSFLFLVFVFSLIPRLRQDLFSGEDYPYFFIDVQMPAGTNRDKTLQVVKEFEEKLKPLTDTGEVVGILSNIGSLTNTLVTGTRNNVAQIVVHLKREKEGGKRSVTSLLNEARTLTEGIPGPEQVSYRKVQGGPPVDPPIVLRFRGDRFEELRSIVETLRERMGTYPSLINIEDSLERGTPEFRIRVNEFQATRFGLTPSSIGAFIRGTLEGFTAGRVFIDNEERDILVRYRSSTANLSDLSNLKIPTPSGSFVPFSAVCTLLEEEPISSIKRVDGKREVSIQAELLNKKEQRKILQELQAYVKAEILPFYPEVEFIAGGEFAEFANLLIQILQIFLLGIFLIYLILSTQFRSYTQPFLILITIPFSLMGVVLYLYLFQVPLSTTVIYAGVALAGIAVNDAIVLIDLLNRLRKEGVDVDRAIPAAVGSRLRPIILTSITTMAGLIPTALGLGGASPVWGPMSGTIVFGLLFSTLSSLVVVPCLYGSFTRKDAREA